MTKPKRYWSSKKGEGAAIKWILAHVSYDGDGCLIWPFCRKETGYGMLGWNGESYAAHRLMCKFVKGEPPTPNHEAAHSCGKGHEGCIHPKHLSWKTASENQRDRRRHGTHGKGSVRFKLTREQAMEIRAQKNIKTQAELAKIYGVIRATIGMIHRGETWKETDGRKTRYLKQSTSGGERT